MEIKLLTINKYSRPGIKLKGVKGIVIHYVANTNSSAIANRNFFENRKYGNKGYGSAHYVIGLNGEIIQCIPRDEMAYHVGASSYKDEAIRRLSTYPNNCTLGIECCHYKDDGEMTEETYNSLVNLTKGLLKEYNLTSDDLYLHYDITGKICHKWFVNNPNEWENFKGIVGGNNMEKTEVPSWAKEAWEWAKENGINDGKVDSEEEIRTMCYLYRYHQKFNR